MVKSTRESLKGLPPAVQRSAQGTIAIKDAMQPIAEDFAGGNAINWFSDKELYEYGAADYIKFLESTEYDQMVTAFTKSFMDKKYRKIRERENALRSTSVENSSDGN